jgi:phosphoglycerol transferase MdoB-like AlkP superfamily enzyme
MKQRTELSDRRLLFYSFLLYFLLWLAELALRVLAVMGRFSSGKVTSSLIVKVKEGLVLLWVDLGVYILALWTIYAFFAFLNWRYALLAASWFRAKKPGSVAAPKPAAFLIIQGVFITVVYGLNASLYPSSSLAPMPETSRALKLLNDAKPIFLFALGLYFLGFLLLSLRRKQSAVGYTALFLAILLAFAPLDPVYQIRQLLPKKGKGGNGGPNVIMIGLDSLNPRHTGYFGYPLPTTPRLDAFLKETIIFNQCYTPLARTFPAWYSILTGQYPKTSGVRFNLIKRKNIKSEAVTLPNVLRRQGYYTAYATDEVRFSNILGADGFDELAHAPMGIKDFVFGSFHDFSLTNVFFNNPLGFAVFPFLKHNRAVAHLYDGRYFINHIVSSLDRLSSHERFFFAVHLCIAHWPFDHASPRPLLARAGTDPSMEPYDSALTKLDGQFGRLMAAIKELGLYENSIIVVLSDHGESAEGHGTDLRNTEQNRVLLAWKPIGRFQPHVVESLVSTIDIAPTVLDSLGIQGERVARDGLSLKPFLSGGAEPEAFKNRHVFIETEFSFDTPEGVGTEIQKMIEEGVNFYEFDNQGIVTIRDDFHDLLIQRRHRAVMSLHWKLVLEMNLKGSRFAPEIRLIDMKTDPRGANNIVALRADIYKEYMKYLDKQYGTEIAMFH